MCQPLPQTVAYLKMQARSNISFDLELVFLAIWRMFVQYSPSFQLSPAPKGNGKLFSD